MQYLKRVLDLGGVTMHSVQSGTHRGFKWVIGKNYEGTWVAYVQLPNRHPLAFRDYMGIEIDAPIYGGITYGEARRDHPFLRPRKYYIGWDYNHGCDYSILYPNNDKRPISDVLGQVFGVCRALANRKFRYEVPSWREG